MSSSSPPRFFLSYSATILSRSMSSNIIPRDISHDSVIKSKPADTIIYKAHCHFFILYLFASIRKAVLTQRRDIKLVEGKGNQNQQQYEIMPFIFSHIRKQKKSHVVTTSDFQKTNYLKTNLLKQIKKISTLGFISIMYQSFAAKILHLHKSSKFFSQKIVTNTLKTLKRGTKQSSFPLFVIYSLQNYIIPPIPGLPIGIAGFSSGLSTIRHSVVRNMPAIEAAFSRATRATLAGSITPALRMSS